MADAVEVHWADPDGPTAADVERFVVDGVLGVREAVPRALAEECRDLLLAAAGIDPADRSTWTRPVVRITDRHDGLVAEAAQAPRLLAATDALVGPGRWVTYSGMGSFAIRVPTPTRPATTAGTSTSASRPTTTPAPSTSPAGA